MKVGIALDFRFSIAAITEAQLAIPVKVPVNREFDWRRVRPALRRLPSRRRKGSSVGKVPVLVSPQFAGDLFDDVAPFAGLRLVK